MTLRKTIGPTLALAACLLALPLAAQVPGDPSPGVREIPDPANLTGEHISPQDPADTLPINHGAAALEQLLLKLRTRASMMFIVAHPDDEDGGLLTYESRGQGARVAMLTLTRGEGGQNLMSADFDEALGLIRTQELLAEDRYTGVDQMFGTEIDFGFSKTKEETLEKWTHDRVLYDAVRAVRLYRPLVLASVFVGGPTDGHGHHQVAGEICQEVFNAAADPKVFPEMGLPPWAPLKVYARVPFSRVTPQGMFDYATGKTIPLRFQNYVNGTVSTTVPQASVMIHEGEPATALGKPTLGMDGLSYVQFARKGLALQKTQIGGGERLAAPGPYEVGYTRYGSRVPNQQAQEQSLFDGIDASLNGIATLVPGAPAPFRNTLARLDARLADAQHAFDPEHPEALADPLCDSLRLLDQLIASAAQMKAPAVQVFNVLHELRIKRVQVNQALTLALHISFKPRLGTAVQLGTGPAAGLTAGQTAVFAADSSFSPLHTLLVKRFTLTPRPHLFVKDSGVDTGPRLTNTLSEDPPLSRPYFSRSDPQQPFYTVADPSLRNAPATPPSFVEELYLAREKTVEDPQDDTEFEVSGVVVGSPASTQPVKVVPALSIRMDPAVAIDSTRTEAPLEISVTVRSSVTSVAGKLKLNLPAHWTSTPPDADFALSGDSAEKTFQFTLLPEGKLASDRDYKVTAVAIVEHREFTESYRPVGYSGLPLTNLYTPAVLNLVAVDVVTAPGLKVGYLPGTGDAVPASLAGLGVHPTMLTLADLTPTRLAGFDAVVLGVRAYAAHPELAGAGSKPLNDFAAAGGVVIVQYNSASETTGTAPYPFTVPGDSAHNVVVEADPVTILAPTAPLLNWPNKITAADFNGWVEERGHGFASTWDPHYTPLLETHDPDQDPQQGGLLVAPVGKGTYIYVALALYRQLPEGVPGAYRLFANLLSLSKNPLRKQ